MCVSGVKITIGGSDVGVLVGVATTWKEGSSTAHEEVQCLRKDATNKDDAVPCHHK